MHVLLLFMINCLFRIAYDLHYTEANPSLNFVFTDSSVISDYSESRLCFPDCFILEGNGRGGI